MSIRLTDEAEQDLQDAASWYEQHRPGLGHGFLDEFLATEARISASPMGYQLIHGHVRRAFMRRFPFAVMYFLRDSEIWVIGVMHFRRDPMQWQSR